MITRGGSRDREFSIREVAISYSASAGSVAVLHLIFRESPF